MKVQNMKSASGREVPNQFIITDGTVQYFQSYETIIVKREPGKVTLDRDAWNCSKTTSKYRNLFLGETTKETLAKINSGEYELADLNH